MSKSKQHRLPGFEGIAPELTNCNSCGSDRWYYLYKPLTDEMMVLDEHGNWAWCARDTINNTPHLFNTRKLAKQAKQKMAGAVITRYNWAVR